MSGAQRPGYVPDSWQFLMTPAGELGFCALGVLPADAIPAERIQQYNDWLARGDGADMAYLTRNAELRSHPARLMEGGAMLVCVALPYGEGRMRGGIWEQVAAYARGRDYHRTLKKKLKRLGEDICQWFPGARCRVFVDSAPLMERTLAVMAGLGTIGKSGMLIVPGVGPRVLLGEVLVAGVNSEPPTPPSPWDPCAGCNRCVAACPTGALFGNGELDARKCLSWHTIESGGKAIPPEAATKMTMLFGCDVCTDVCPRSRPINSGLEPALHRSICDDLTELAGMEEAQLQERVAGTPMHRTGAAVLLRNARTLLENGANEQ